MTGAQPSRLVASYWPTRSPFPLALPLPRVLRASPYTTAPLTPTSRSASLKSASFLRRSYSTPLGLDELSTHRAVHPLTIEPAQ